MRKYFAKQVTSEGYRGYQISIPVADIVYFTDELSVEFLRENNINLVSLTVKEPGEMTFTELRIGHEFEGEYMQLEKTGIIAFEPAPAKFLVDKCEHVICGAESACVTVILSKQIGRKH